MKIKVDDRELFALSETQKKVLQHDIPAEIFEEDMKRRLQWVLTHKYEQCMARLKKEWEPKLAENGVASIPTNPDALAELIFRQPNYKNRSQRDAQAKAANPQ